MALLAQRMLNEDLRVRWFRSPTGRELTLLAGPLRAPDHHDGLDRPEDNALTRAETALLRLLTEGRTNREIAYELGMTEEATARQLAELYIKIGASSRADATAAALIRRLV
jgi:DNA-binding NarL/FixJ family response regulator